MTNQTLSLQITKKLEIVFTSAGADYSLDDPQWAINWFDVKSKWLYDLYNKLAYPHVAKVGGKPFFKGRLIERLLGDLLDERKMLLIVNYGNAQSFLDMIGNREFQMKSLVREAAVKDFTFGFVRRTDVEESSIVKAAKYEGDKKYLVHHFKNDHQSVNIQAIKSEAESHGIRLHFSGIKSARLGGKKEGKELKNAPFLMDGILIFEADSETRFAEQINTEFYQKFIEQNDSNYLGLFDREF